MIVFRAIGQILDGLIVAYCLVMLASFILNLAKADPYSQIMQILNRLTLPVYDFLKRFVRTEFNGLDFAPLIIFIILQFISLTLVRFLITL